MEENQVDEAMYISDDDVEPVGISSMPTASLPPNHHPRKLPNIPRNPEIYEPSPGIFKYIRKDSRTPFSTKDSSTDSAANYLDDGEDESNSCSVAKRVVSDEMSVELECYDEAAHIVCMSQKIEPEALKRQKDGASKDNIALTRTANVASKVVGVAQEPNTSSNNSQNLYRPPKLDDRNIAGLHLPPTSTNSVEIQRINPVDSDDFATLKSKLNRAMQLYTVQRRELIRLSGKVKSLTRKNQRLSEQAQASNSSKNFPSPCLATDTKYVLLFENLICPEAMNTIMNAMATAKKP